MKRIFLILTAVLTVCCCFFLSPEALAAESEVYVISREGDGLALSVSDELIKEGEINELLSEIPDGSLVTFDGVELDGSLEIPMGSYTFSGDLKLSSGSITVREGAKLMLVEFTLDSSSNTAPGINVRGGELTASSCDIVSGGGGAILADYSQNSAIVIENTSVKCASAAAAVMIQSGSLSVISGSIKNTLGTAIENRSQLALAGEPDISGVPTDVISDKSISLTASGKSYVARYALRVTYDGFFAQGGAYEIFNKATEASISRMTLFDKNGKEYKLTYFADSPGTGDGHVAAVYLPFTVKFIDGAREISSIPVLKDGPVSLPDAPTREGYEFLCWTTASGESFDMSYGVIDDMTLYSKYKLLSPNFKISSLNVAYTGQEHTLAFSEVSHPLDKSGGFAEFVWYKSGKVVSRGRSVSVESVSDSGEYSCLITYYYESDSQSVLVEEISVSISPKEISPPAPESAVYDGSVKLPTGLDASLYSFECEGFTDVGVYQITLTLKDRENCVFVGTKSDVAVISFEITRAKNEFKLLPDVKNIYEGTAINLKCEALFGDVYFMYSDKKEGEYTKEEPVRCGKYYLIACVAESKNYESLKSEPYSFEIMEDHCVSLEITEREDATYTAFERFVGNGVFLLARYKSGREESVGMSSLSVRYQRGSYLRWGDSGVILSYGGINITYPLTVEKADYSLDTLDFSEYRVTYDGKYHEYPTGSIKITGHDKIPLTVKTVGGGTNAGEYKVRIVFSTESTDYNTPAERECVMIIERAKAELLWTNLSFVYDGTKKKPTCSYTDVFGIVRYPEVYGEKTGAGVGYTAHVDTESGNYSFTNGSVEFEIKKGSYDLSSVKWVGGEYVYNGSEQSVSLTGLPAGVTIVGYTDACETNAGKYLANATLAYDAENYNKPTIEPHAWTIHKASYDFGDFAIENATVTFDGGTHYPKVTGSAPTGLDGIALKYTFSHGAVHVSDSDRGIRVEFSTESVNYSLPDAKVLYVTVLPKEVSVIWHDSEFTYSGGAQLPKAECGECEIEVTGAAIGAGEYTATAKSKNPDYLIKNSSFAFKINKAQNKFIGEIRVDDVYTDREVKYEAKSLFGKADIHIYSDSECTAPAKISSSGKYYIVFEVPESENYFGLRSEPIEILAIELAIIDIKAELLKGELRAFEKLASEDFVLTAIYNDGSESVCDSAQIIVRYQSADSLRRADTELTFVFDGREVKLEIKVDYASYDLSGVRWESLAHTFDGEEKYPTLTGLPQGVTLLGFCEVGAVSVGEYSFTPLLSYDSENYTEPTIEPAKMVINKQIIPSPSKISVKYDGTSHTPNSENPLYTLVFDSEIRGVGEYVGAAVLSDDKNYAFSDGGNITVIVLPREIYVTVSDAKMLSDGAFSDVKYEITDGSVIDGDELALTPVVIDGAVSLTTANKNYVLLVTPGKLISTSRALGDLKVALITIAIALFVVLIAYLLYVGRRRIFGKLYATASLAPQVQLKAALPKIIEEKAEETVEEVAEEVTEEITGETEAECDPEPAEDKEKDNSNDLMERAEKIGKVEIDMEKADSLITDALARDLIKRAEGAIKTSGNERSIINVDTISEYFYPGERVDINVLKRRGLIPPSVSFIKVLARGRIDKPLSVYANEFTPAAVKMIVLSGGEAVKAQTVKEKDY